MSRDYRKIETLLDKGSGEINEDAILVKDNLYVVIDGATSLDGFKNRDGKTGGYLASQIVKNVFDRDSVNGLAEIIERANVELRESMVSAGINFRDKAKLWGCALFAVKILEEKGILEWAQLGDCNLIYFDNSSVMRVVEAYNHDKPSLALLERKALKQDRVKLDSEIRQSIIDVRRRANVNYGMLNGEPKALNFMEKGNIPLSEVASFCIFSDGLLFPSRKPSVENTDYGRMGNFLLKEGIKGLLKHVRETENDDLEKISYPRFKIHDDISCIYVSLEGDKTDGK
ncbi:MAG: hypothetical protein AABW79_04050 [Nanoarchaeota archaeon]